MAAPDDVRFRPIREADDARIADLVRTVMTEFGCTGEGFAIVDPELGAMSAAYPGGDACFFVVEVGGAIRGCGGFGRLAGTEPAEATCELRKMYFEPTLRGRGVGARFLDFLLERMREAGFATCYLETTSWMDAARHLYEKRGFAAIPGPKGRTGHCGCDRFFVLPLEPRTESPPPRSPRMS